MKIETLQLSASKYIETFKAELYQTLDKMALEDVYQGNSTEHYKPAKEAVERAFRALDKKFKL